MVPAAYRELLAIRRARLPAVASLRRATAPGLRGSRDPLPRPGPLRAPSRTRDSSRPSPWWESEWACRFRDGWSITWDSRASCCPRRRSTRRPWASSSSSRTETRRSRMLAALSALSGLTIPPISSCMRGLWAAMLDDARGAPVRVRARRGDHRGRLHHRPAARGGPHRGGLSERGGAGRRHPHARGHRRLRRLGRLPRVASRWPGRGTGRGRCARGASGS